MNRIVLTFAAALMLARPAAADVIPPPEEITEIQQALVGTWQQTGPTGLMGHGEGVETLAFDKERFGSIYMFALRSSAMYQANTRRGTWTGERMSDTEIKVTLTWEDGAAPEVLNVHFTSETTIEIPKRGRATALVPYTRVYP